MARLGRSQPARPIILRTRPAGAPSGYGTITGSGVLTGSGTKNAAGSAQITGVVVLSGTGSKGAVGSGMVTGTVDLSGAGEKQSGIGSIPRPRLRWQFIVGPAAGGHELALSEAKSRRFTARLVDPSEVGFSINGRHSQAAAIRELATDIHVLWTPSSGATEILARSRVGATGDTLDTDKHTIDVPALDYRALLNRRRLFSGDTLTWTGVDQAEIAYQLIEQTQARLGGDLGISKGWSGTTPTGMPRDRTYELGDSIGERIQELSEVINGFDWDITPVSASALELDVWYPQRGANRGVVLELGGLIAAARREVPVADYANAIRMTGEESLLAQEREAPDLGSFPEGRWDAVFGETGLTTQAALDERADWQIDQSQVVRPSYSLTLRQGAWDGPDHMWLGDTVQVVIMSGSRRVNTLLRIFEMAFTIGDDGQETVELTVGGPKPNPYRRESLVDQRLRNLERR